TRARSPSPVMQICVQCEFAFDTTDNRTNSCRYHNGEMEFNRHSRIWLNFGTKDLHLLDTDLNRKRFPRGFTWSCCDKNGQNEGCRMGRHVSDPAKNKRHGRTRNGSDSDCSYDSDFSTDRRRTRMRKMSRMRRTRTTERRTTEPRSG
ncbi:hypothetical protein QBC34DRAFT_297107, partial [Podospora aff. communis PSN243]